MGTTGNIKTKDISQYLHLYIGCELYTGTGRVTLIAVQKEVIPCTNFRVICLNGNVTHEIKLDDIKPILRKIQDITEEERKELWKYIFKQGFGAWGTTVFIKEATTSSDPRYVMSSGVNRLGIEMNGTVWADTDLSFFKHNQHEVTLWFINKKIDLFNLIESGLAIDQKTFKP